MFRKISYAVAALLVAMPASAESVSFLLCEYDNLGDGQRWKVQTIPLYYERDELIAIGRRNHCVDEPQYILNENYAGWRCVTALNEDQTPAKSIYVAIHRFTGRYHRNDFSGHSNEMLIDDIWHGVCTPHHEAQF